MIRTTSIAALVGAVISLAAFSRPSASRPSREPTRSVWDSVYSDAQAARGDSLYKTNCAKCHLATLAGGDDGSPLVGDVFLSDFDTKTVGELVDRIRNSMPTENPKSLPRATVVDITAYLLAQNKYPSGKNELPTDGEQLANIRIDKSRR